MNSKIKLHFSTIIGVVGLYLVPFLTSIVLKFNYFYSSTDSLYNWYATQLPLYQMISLIGFRILPIIGIVFLFKSIFSYRKIGVRIWPIITLLLITLWIFFLSLNCTRCLGPNHAVINYFGRMNTSAEEYYNNNGNSYIGFCRTQEEYFVKNYSKISKSSNMVCLDSKEKWSISAKLMDKNDRYLCRDSMKISTTTNNHVQNTSCI